MISALCLLSHWEVSQNCDIERESTTAMKILEMKDMHGPARIYSATFIYYWILKHVYRRLTIYNYIEPAILYLSSPSVTVYSIYT